jgi:mevalonate kinase
MATASAPGKVILFGEHSIVYPGHMGLAAAINKRAYAKANSNNENYVEIFTEIENPVKVYEPELKALLKDFKESFYIEPKNIGGLKELNNIYNPLAPIKLILAELFEKYGFEGLEIKIDSEIPNKSHLGSGSSAFAATAGAVLAELTGRLNIEQISDLTYHGDSLLVGNPSGIDNSVVSYGGWIRYSKLGPQKGEITQLSNLGEFQTVVANSGIQSETGKMVGLLREKITQNPDMIKYLDDINSICEAGLLNIKQKNLADIGSCMNKNHKILSSLGVSHKELDKLVDLALQNGAYGAKLTGAGGGGCIIAVTENPNMLIEKFRTAGYDAFVAELGTEGIRLEPD